MISLKVAILQAAHLFLNIKRVGNHRKYTIDFVVKILWEFKHNFKRDITIK